MINTAGRSRLEIQPHENPYESLFHSIQFQQLHGNAARAILGRIKEQIGGGAIPAPQVLLAASDERLRAAGVPRQKIAALRDLAEKTLAGVVPDWRHIQPLDDEAIIARLTQVRGIRRLDGPDAADFPPRPPRRLARARLQRPPRLPARPRRRHLLPLAQRRRLVLLAARAPACLSFEKSQPGNVLEILAIQYPQGRIVMHRAGGDGNSHAPRSRPWQAATYRRGVQKQHASIHRMQPAGQAAHGAHFPQFGFYIRVGGRTQELGVRAALGARPGQVLGMVLRQALALTVLGLGIGLGLSLQLTRYLHALLFGINPANPVILAGAALLPLLAGLAAAWWPARSAMAVDPAQTLHCE
ncbi:MAG: FtsX-like permease family protein [Terriglobales bacterium]